MSARPRRPVAALAAAGAGLLLAACATTAERMAPARAAWEAGDPEAALAVLDGLRPDAGTDVALVDLERASALLALGRFGPCADAAEAAVRLLDAHEQGDIGEWALAGVTDDTALAFEGADHEKVLARALPALALLADGRADEARALALQVNRVQERLRARAVLPGKDPGRPGYRPFAFGEYLQALVDEMRGNFDEAAIGYGRAAEILPAFPGSAEALARVRRSRLVEGEGTGAVVVLALLGPGPVLEEVAEPVTSVVAMAASAVINARKGAFLPSQAPVLVPRPRPRASPLRDVAVEVDGRERGATAVLLDVDDAAVRQWGDDMPRILLRAVVRRAFKEIAKNQVRSAVSGGRNASAEAVLVDVAGLLWTATERADTRCWSLLPKTVQVARIEAPVGERTLRLVPRRAGGGAAGPAVEVPLRVEAGRISVVLLVAPSDRAVPRVHVDPLSMPSTRP